MEDKGKFIEFVGFEEVLKDPALAAFFIVWVLALAYWVKIIFFGG